MVNIVLEYKSVDEAIVALGKLAGAPSVPSKEAAAAPQGAVTDAPATRTRKPRSDAGQERGKYKPRQQEAATDLAAAPKSPPATEGVAGAAPSGSPVTEDAQPVPVAAPAATRADAQAALEALVSGVNLDAGIKLLAEFGTQRLRDLPDAELREFVKKAKAALPKAPA